MITPATHWPPAEALRAVKAARDQLRGHPIAFDDTLWVYRDTGSPTVSSDRPCGHCGRARTAEGHDGCLGTLPGVMNACCGHGIEGEAYIQFWTGARIAGKAAMEVSTEMTKQKALDKANRHLLEVITAASKPLEHLASALGALTAANAIRATPERRVKRPARRGTIDTRTIRKAVAMARARRLWGTR